jgi:hypothetical protein
MNTYIYTYIYTGTLTRDRLNQKQSKKINIPDTFPRRENVFKGNSVFAKNVQKSVVVFCGSGARR